jgi:hypothetical protein
MSSLLSPPSLPPLSLLIRLDSGGEIIAHSRLSYKVRAKESRENWVVVNFTSAERNFKLATQLLNGHKLLPRPPWCPLPLPFSSNSPDVIIY